MSARSYWDASTRRGHGRMTQRSFMTIRDSDEDDDLE